MYIGTVIEARPKEQNWINYVENLQANTWFNYSKDFYDGDNVVEWNMHVYIAFDWLITLVIVIQ